MRTKNLKQILALLQLQLCLQLQQNIMVPVDVDGQICHFCSQVFVREQIREISISVFGRTRRIRL